MSAKCQKQTFAWTTAPTDAANRCNDQLILNKRACPSSVVDVAVSARVMVTAGFRRRINALASGPRPNLRALT
jgi:hypothetical protein